MTFEELEAAFDAIGREAFRLEVQQSYAGVSDPGWDAWQAGRQLPTRTADSDEWLAKIAAHVSAGRRVYRVLVIDWPLSDYKRYELAAFAAHVPVGEGIYVVDRGAHPGLAGLVDDFWMLDERIVAIMRFDAKGAPLGLTEPTEPLSAYIDRRNLAMRLAAPLDLWVADHRERLSA